MENFRQFLWRELGFLARSCDSFDQGFSDEAIRVAVVVRVLVHQTRGSTSLLTHLHAADIHLLTTRPWMPLEDCVLSFGLGAIEGDRYIAHLGKSPVRRMIPVGEWWNEVVFVLGTDTRLTRRDIVLAAANKDGGAHVDEALTPAYEKLISFLQIGSWAESGSGEWRDANMHFAALRQMGYELLNSPELLMQAEAPPRSEEKEPECQAVERYRFLMTDRVRQLFKEANELIPQHPVICAAMENGDPVPEDATRTYVVASGTRDVVHFDPAKATEYTVAQDLMHTILWRSGWPMLYPVLPPGADRDVDLIIREVIRVFRQCIVGPGLVDLGFDVSDRPDQVAREVVAWPTTRVADRDLFSASMRILEVMLWNDPRRETVLEAMSIRQPEALDLARELGEEILSDSHRTKTTTRVAIVRLLHRLDAWVTEQADQSFELHKRVVVTPVLSGDQLAQPAHAVTDFLSYPLCIGDASNWIVGLAMKSDSMLIGRKLLKPTSTEPESVAELRSLWETYDLRRLLDVIPVRFGTVD